MWNTVQGLGVSKLILQTSSYCFLCQRELKSLYKYNHRSIFFLFNVCLSIVCGFYSKINILRQCDEIQPRFR